MDFFANLAAPNPFPLIGNKIVLSFNLFVSSKRPAVTGFPISTILLKESFEFSCSKNKKLYYNFLGKFTVFFVFLRTIFNADQASKCHSQVDMQHERYFYPLPKQIFHLSYMPRPLHISIH